MINYFQQANEGRDASGGCNRLFQEGSPSAWSPRAKWDLAERRGGSWEDPGLLSDTELHSHRQKNPINVTVIYWIFHFPFPLCCLVFVGFMASAHPWASPVLFCSRGSCAISSESSSGLVSHLYIYMKEKQQEMRFRNVFTGIFIVLCEQWNTIKPANNRAEKLTFWRKWKRFIIYQSLPIHACTTKKKISLLN